MYPKQHLLVSGTTTLLAAFALGAEPSTIFVWTVIGGAAGVLIDVDHALLSMMVKGRWRKGAYWFRHPVSAVTRPDTFLEDMDYERLIFHRLVSHIVIMLVLAALSTRYSIVLPALIGVMAHIVADVYWDLREGNYSSSA